MISANPNVLENPDSTESLAKRVKFLEKIAEIGDWTHDFRTNHAVWSDYLYQFYEVGREYDPSTLLDNQRFYKDEEYLKIKSFVELAVVSGTQCEDEFKIVMPDGRVKWHKTIMVPIFNDQQEVCGLHGVLMNITNRKQAEVQERKDKQFYSYIFENIPTQLVVLNAEGRYVYVNQRAIQNPALRAKIVGMNNSEYGEMRNWDPAIGIRRDEMVRVAIEEKHEVVFEEEMPDGNGGMRYYIRTMYPLLDEKGNTEYIVGYGLETTELKRFQDINTTQQTAIEKAMDGMALLDANGVYYYMNLSHARIFGYDSPSELIGKTWTEIYHQPEIDRISNDLFPLLMQNGYWSGTTLGKKKDGTPVYQEITLTSLPKGELLCICRDVTDQVKQKIELERLAVVAEKTNSIVMITDAERKLQWVNDSFTRILGFTKEEVMGKDPGIIMNGPETSRETIAQVIDALELSGSYSGEILNYTKYGKKIWLYLDITAVYDKQGKLLNYIAVESDITPIKEAEQKLKKAIDKERELNKFKTQFISLASHQFRTPLAAIRSSIDVLELKSEENPDVASFMKTFGRYKQIMIEETVRMTEIMENILDISRMDEGKIDVAKKERSLKGFMDDFVSSNPETQGQKRELAYSFDAPDQVILMDEILIRNVLRNVVSNAFKYSAGMKAPELNVVQSGDGFEIRVRDYGVGIPKEDQQHLFQSFFRASNVKAFPGTGLGLMIAKKLIELHGGSIAVESESGKGCTVSIKLPKE